MNTDEKILNEFLEQENKPLLSSENSTEVLQDNQDLSIPVSIKSEELVSNAEIPPVSALSLLGSHVKLQDLFSNPIDLTTFTLGELLERAEELISNMSDWVLVETEEEDLSFEKTFSFIDDEMFDMFVSMYLEMQLYAPYTVNKRKLLFIVQAYSTMDCLNIDKIYGDLCVARIQEATKEYSELSETQEEEKTLETEFNKLSLKEYSILAKANKAQQLSQSGVLTITEEQPQETIKNNRIRLGVARLGAWKHPQYKVVEFTQKDFDDMIQNFESKELGFEPPLFLGHTKDGLVTSGNSQYETTGGEPAEGFLVSLKQEGDVLYSEWEIVNPACYLSVKQSQYRYNSGEFLRHYVSKRDGKSKGTVLLAMALTNKPFVPDLPRVMALSESNSDIAEIEVITFPKQTQKDNMKDDLDTAQTETSEKETLSDSTKFLKEKLSQTEKQLLTVEDAYKQQLSEQQSVIQNLSEQLRQINLTEKIDRIEKLALPREVKDKHIEMLKDGSLGKAEESIISSLEMIASVKDKQLFSQQGTATETARVAEEAANPYAAIIERNKKNS